ncbi:MAG: formylglycine-generating enzyme family protein [Wenzhouxiangellaceae bacterium]
MHIIKQGMTAHMKFRFNALIVVLALPLAGVLAQDAADEPQQEETHGREVRRLQDVIGEQGSDFSMDLPTLDLPQAAGPRTEARLPDPDLDERLQTILATRAFNPSDPDVGAAYEAILDEIAARAESALNAGDLQVAGQYVNVLVELDEQRPVVARVEQARDRAAELQRVLSQADSALESGNLFEPPNASALALYRRALELDSGNARAQAGIEAVTERGLARFSELLDESDFEAAEALLQTMEERQIAADRIEAERARLAEARADQLRNMISTARAAIDGGRFDAAEQAINELIAFGAEADLIAQLRRSLEDAVRYAGFEPGQLFQDEIDGADSAPVMVVIPAGSFMMGSPDNEPDRADNEGPRFRVTFERGFGMARYETTVGQFRAFIEASGYVTDAERRGSSRIYIANSGTIGPQDDVNWRHDYLGQRASDDLPVIHVSWNDARAYVRWLAERTERPYRLPSEAEFEYALRAGTQTRYWWGDDRPREPVENVTGDGDRFQGGRSWEVAFRRYDDGFWGPAPVGSLKPNPFGLYDMGGNVAEWVEDCWHDSYVRAPTDGSAWVNPGCNRRVIRGAQWSSTPAMARSAFRLSATPSTTDARVGFRVARDL